MAFVKIFGVLVIALTGVSVAQESCLLTETSCQCSPSTPSGTCLRSQGDGTCLLGLCAEGYRCDCFGFEKCSIKKCGKHVPAGGIPSESVPFKCIFESDAGTCTEAMGFMDTAGAAKNAVADAHTSQDEATATETDGVRLLDEILDGKKAVNQMMKEVETKAKEMAVDELEEIEKEAAEVLEAVSKAGTIVMGSIEDAKLVARLTGEARRAKRDAEKFEAEAAELREMTRQERGRTPVDRRKVAKLEGEAGELEERRAKAATAAGKHALEAREHKTKCRRKFREAVGVKERARAATGRFMQKCERALGRTKKGGVTA